MTTRHSWKTFKSADFISRLRSTALCTPDDFDPGIDNLAAQYNSIITALLDEMAPTKTVVLRVRPQRPWYDDECRKTRKVARRHESKFTADRKPESRTRWHDALESSRKLSQSKAAAYWRVEVNAAGGNARRVWRTVDNLLGENKSATKPNFSPEDYHDLIDSKIAGVRAATAAAPAPVFASCTAPDFTSFRAVSTDDVVLAIRSSPVKHSQRG